MLMLNISAKLLQKNAFSVSFCLELKTKPNDYWIMNVSVALLLCLVVCTVFITINLYTAFLVSVSLKRRLLPA